MGGRNVNFTEILTRYFPDAKKNGNGSFHDYCPAHQDTNASLTISETPDGRTLIHCHAKCATSAIAAAKGFRMSDLFPDSKARPTAPAQSFAKKIKLHATLEAASAAALYGVRHEDGCAGYNIVGDWKFTNAAGNEVAHILRMEDEAHGRKGKKFRPVCRDGGGWRVGDPVGLWPLYGLAELVAPANHARVVYACEGEGKTDAARAIGLLATASSHGANSAKKTDWTPLAGREVVILPDNDPAGEGYAAAVLEIISALVPPARARIVHLPDLPAGGDIREFIEARAGTDPAAIAAEVENIAKPPAPRPMTDSEREPDCECGYYDRARKEFLILNKEQIWINHADAAFRRILRERGLSGKVDKDSPDPLSEIDREMFTCQDERTLSYAGLLAGWEQGVHVIPQVGRVVVTRGPEHIEPRAGDWPTLHNFISTLLCDHPEQMPTFLAWLKIAVTSLRAKTFRPGQALAFCGPKDCGKSLLQQLITVILGGRAARPYQFMSGRTEFNQDLFTAEHLVIEDDAPSTRLDDRRSFGTKLKAITATEGQRMHAKGRDAVLLPVFWRVTISVNDEPENLMVLPPMDDSLMDKLMLFQARRADIPPTDDNEDRKAYWDALTAELPAFIHYLLAMEIDPARKAGRFGVRCFNHPTILQSIFEIAPEFRLQELIDHELFAPLGLTASTWEGPTSDLERRLIQSDTTSYDARKLLTFNTAIGVYLARLAAKNPARYEKHHTNAGNVWRIHPPSHS